MGSKPISHSKERKNMKKIITTIAKYISLIIFGMILFIPCRTYAMAHRVDPNLIGGEILILFVPVIVGLLIDANKYYNRG